MSTQLFAAWVSYVSPSQGLYWDRRVVYMASPDTENLNGND